MIRVDDPDLARAIGYAGKIARRTPVEQFLSAAWLGLMDARRMWSPSGGRSFNAYLFSRVRSRCMDEWRAGCNEHRKKGVIPRARMRYIEDMSGPDDRAFDVPAPESQPMRLDLDGMNLDGTDKMVLKMRFESDCTLVEIAQTIGGLSEASGSLYLSGALRRAKAAMA